MLLGIIWTRIFVCRNKVGRHFVSIVDIFAFEKSVVCKFDLQWCFEYYSSECRDWRFTYEYHYPPLLTDLVQYIPDFNTNFIVEERGPFANNFRLLHVLPSCHYQLLPNRVHHYLLEHQPKFFKEMHDSIWAFCRYFWECHVCFEHISTHDWN